MISIQASPTYASNYEEKLITATGGINASDRADQYFVQSLIRRMGGSAVFCEGSSVVLYRGVRQHLCRDDYSLTARVSDGVWEIPAAFAAEHFGVFAEADGRSYIRLEQLCDALEGYTLLCDEVLKLCILQDPAVCSFADGADELNLAYRTRMKAFYCQSAILPEPRVNVAESRTVVSEAPYPADITDWRTSPYITCYSPAILCRTVQGKKCIYVANEFSKVLNWKELETVTVIKKSTDEGKTWQEVTRLPHIRWGGMFEVNGVMYLSGTNGERHAVSIYRFRDDMSYDEAHFDFGCGWTSPNTVLVKDGRVYQALGTSTISAPADADLLQRDSWTVSTSLRPILTKEWFLEQSGEPQANRFTVMEGNLLESPEGRIYNIMRIESQPAAGYAAILEVTPDGREYLPVERCRSLLHFPTSVSKFVIRRDEKSGYYYSLTSVKTIPHFGDQRSILSLVWSKDLFDWQTAEILLVDREMMNPVCSAYAHSFQYVDFVIDGDDILMAVREAAGRTNIWHDGTHITFYRIPNFRALTEGKEEK